jgi:hypothetical protein
MQTPAAVYKDEEEIVDKSITMREKQNIMGRRNKNVNLRPLKLAKNWTHRVTAVTSIFYTCKTFRCMWDGEELSHQRKY